MFKILARLNKILLTSYTRQQLDPARMTKWQQAVLAWRYFVTIRALGK
ncbi:MAG TPA: SsrA-binding protein [Flavobacterium sp.]|nr:SsrA-binding protein [Flavobacterium sp.]